MADRLADAPEFAGELDYDDDYAGEKRAECRRGGPGYTAGQPLLFR